MTVEEAARILRQMYDAGASRKRQTTAIHLFGVKYAALLGRDGLSIKDIVRQSGLSENYADEVSKGRALAEYVEVVKEFP